MSLEAIVRQQGSAIQALINTVQSLQGQMKTLLTRPRSITEAIDAIPGRRIDTVLSGEVAFTDDDEFQRGNPITIQVSQDGPFVMTHYPMAVWRPSAPSNATNFGRWMPVTSFPLPTQQVTTPDIIDIMYELQDGGAQRNFQNAPRGPLLSRPDNIVPAAVPTLWAPNGALVFVPTYNKLSWTSAAIHPTAGILHVDFIGYRIVNM